MSRTLVSIVLPTLDGERDLERLLPGLAGQELDAELELVAIDSESSDRTRALLEAAGARVLSVPRAEFQHGATRNRAAREARGELLVFLSQDAVPRDPTTLAALLAAFEDPRVAGATARVLPHADDDPLTRRTVLEAPEASPEARVVGVEDLPEGASAAESLGLLRFNNVASAIRSSVFREIPFPEVPFGEDAAWALEAVTAGHRIAYVPESVVLHAHRYTPAGAYRRYRTDAAFLRRLYGLRVRPSLLSLARGVAFEVRRDLAFLVAERGPGRLASLARSPFLRTAQVLGQYLGSRG